MKVFTGLRDDWRQTAAQEMDHLPDRADYRPVEWSVHYGSGNNYRTANWGELGGLYRNWWGYHTRLRKVTNPDGSISWVQVMQDIAYNYGAPPSDGTSTEAMRLRGERPNGAHRDSRIWGHRTRTFVFPTGTQTIPTPNQLEAFAKLWQQDPLPVRFHRYYPGQFTQCPGDWLVAWIEREGWKDYLGKRIKPSDKFIDWVFSVGLATGSADYWKNLDANSPEWKDFNAMMQRGVIGWYFHEGYADGDPNYFLALDPRSHEWSDLWTAIGDEVPTGVPA